MISDQGEDEQMATEDLTDRIREALKDVKPGSELDRVLKRWEGHRWTISRDGVLDIGGISTYFCYCLDIMHAVDPSIAPRLGERRL